MPQGATLAGLGSAGALVGAVAAVAALAAGVVGFTAWPTSPSPQHGPAAVSIGTPAPGVVRAARGLALPSATAAQTPALSTGAAAAGAEAAAARRSAAQAVAGDVQQLKASGGRVRPATPGAAGKGQAAPKRSVSSSSPLAPVAAVTDDAARRLGTGVATGGAGIQHVTAPVTPHLGGTVAHVADAAGANVRRAGNAIAQLLGGLGGATTP